MKFKKKLFNEFITLSIVLLGVFSFRYSVAEPYIVPTGSMIPTILPGDRLYVWKLAYDVKVPFIQTPIAEISEPKRGDIIVFDSPVDRSMYLVKRLVGIPGDHILVKNGVISLNGTPCSYSETEGVTAQDVEPGYFGLQETLSENIHFIQKNLTPTPQKNVEITVPSGHYFFLGDNRDNSHDGRYWGVVPRTSLKGKAFIVWLSSDWQDMIPRIRWNRTGKLLL